MSHTGSLELLLVVLGCYHSRMRSDAGSTIGLPGDVAQKQEPEVLTCTLPRVLGTPHPGLVSRHYIALSRQRTGKSTPRSSTCLAPDGMSLPLRLRPSQAFICPRTISPLTPRQCRSRLPTLPSVTAQERVPPRPREARQSAGSWYHQNTSDTLSRSRLHVSPRCSPPSVQPPARRD